MDIKDRQKKNQGTYWMMGCKDRGYEVGVEVSPRSLVWGSALLFSLCLPGVWALGLCVCLWDTERPRLIVPMFPPLWPQLLCTKIF